MSMGTSCLPLSTISSNHDDADRTFAPVMPLLCYRILYTSSTPTN